MNTKLNIESIIDGSIEKSKLTESVQESLSKADTAMQSTDVETLLEDFVHKDDTINFANDLTGVVEATPEMFTYRPSAGDKSVRDESAVIRRIKGNTSVWGQYVTTFEEIAQQRVSQFNYLGNGVFEVLDDRLGDNLTLSVGKASDRAIPGHKYLFYVDAEGTYKSIFYAGFSSYSRMEGNWKIDTCVSSSPFYFYPFEASSTIVPKGTRCTIREMLLFDLTAIFGAGNEPTTYEEFREYYPDAYYPYCAPEVRSMRATGIETVGFNQWDEQWENGTFNTETGENISNNQIRCKNLIRILPNTYYSLSIGDKNSGIWAMFYDNNQNILQPVNLNSAVSKNCLYIGLSANRNIFLTPENASWMKFYIVQEYGSTTYKGDICINLSHSGVRNGEYKPYEKNTLLLPEIAKYFPNGMHGIGDVCDEINEEMAIRRIGVVDIGSLEWRYNSTSNIFYTYIYDAKRIHFSKITPAVMLPYTPVTYIEESTPNMSFSLNNQREAYNFFAIRNTNYNDANSFTDAMQGVLLYYQLAEPIYTPIDEPLQLAYKVDDFGTERIISDLPSTPFKADIVYQFNAEGRIRDNSRNIEKLENNINNVQDKLDSKQDTLISGTNIKFINGESVLGEGNLVIDGNNIFVANDLAQETQQLNTTIKQYGELIESKYVKSETGIPVADLSEEVQTSLSKADTAIQLSDLEYFKLPGTLEQYKNIDSNITLTESDWQLISFGVNNRKHIVLESSTGHVYSVTYSIPIVPQELYTGQMTFIAENIRFNIRIFAKTSTTAIMSVTKEVLVTENSLNQSLQNLIYVADFDTYTLYEALHYPSRYYDIDIRPLCDAITQKRTIIVNEETSVSTGGYITNGVINSQDNELVLTVQLSTGCYKITLSTENDIAQLNSDTVTFVSYTNDNIIESVDTSYNPTDFDLESGELLKVQNENGIETLKLAVASDTDVKGGIFSDTYGYYGYSPLIMAHTAWDLYTDLQTQIDNIYYNVSSIVRAGTYELQPNTFYKFGSVSTPLSSIAINLGTEISGVVNEYVFEIYTNATTVPSLSLPTDIKWVSGNAPVLEENKTYQISIVNKLGTVLSWDNA